MMMRIVIASTALILSIPGLCLGQAAGNAGYGEAGAKGAALRLERAKKVLGEHDLPPSGTSMFVEANVLMNVKADEYVAVFALAHEGETVAQCGEKLDATLKAFTVELEPLGVGGKNLFVDFVAQNKIYGYDVAGNVAREKLKGFELKKNVLIRYQDYNLLDKLLTAAAKVQIYDLVKVDYIVKDAAKIQEKLVEEAARIVKQKASRYEKLLGTKIVPPAQIYAERPAIHYPLKLYDAYVAHESEHVERNFDLRGLTVHTARKTHTFYYNGLDGDGFDEVFNPVLVEPAVQFTLYLKVKYVIEPSKGK